MKYKVTKYQSDAFKKNPKKKSDANEIIIIKKNGGSNMMIRMCPWQDPWNKDP